MGLIRTLHAWAGAVLALILAVLGLSGSLLVLKEDWLRLTVPQARTAAAPSPQALGAAVEALERARPGELQTVVFAKPELGLHRVYFTEERNGYADVEGRLVAAWDGTARAEAWLFDLHHYLLAGETGMYVAGAAGLAGVVLVLTGLVVWVPAWRSFKGRLWPRSARRRDLVGSHRDLGIVFALPVLLFCLTGGAIVFHETSRAVLNRLFPGEGAAKVDPPPAQPGDIDWPATLAAAQARFPDAQLRIAGWPRGADAPVTVRLRQPGEWHPNGRTVVSLDPATSRVLAATDALAFAPGERVYNGFYPVHAAAVGGRAYDALAFLSGLALAGLGAVGLWSFLVKPRRRRRAQRAAGATRQTALPASSETSSAPARSTATSTGRP